MLVIAADIKHGKITWLGVARVSTDGSVDACFNAKIASPKALTDALRIIDILLQRSDRVIYRTCYERDVMLHAARPLMSHPISNKAQLMDTVVEEYPNLEIIYKKIISIGDFDDEKSKFDGVPSTNCSPIAPHA